MNYTQIAANLRGTVSDEICAKIAAADNLALLLDEALGWNWLDADYPQGLMQTCEDAIAAANE